MNDNMKLCEKLEMTVFSGEKLSDELNNHAKNCEHCRKFLEQNQKLEDDLKKLNVCGIEEGKIADAVMAKVRAEKKKSSIKFNLTHHMGTAAAIVIICAVALVMKNNPSVEPDIVKTEQESSQRDIVIAQIHGVDKTETAYSRDDEELPKAAAGGYFESVVEESTDGAVSESLSMDSDDAEEIVSYRYSQASPISAEDEEPEQYNDAYTGDKKLMSFKPSHKKDSASEENTHYTVDYDALPQGAVFEKAESEEAETEEAAPQVENGVVQELATGFSGSGGSALICDELECEAENDIYADDYLVFEGMEFLQGDENFESNVSLANERLAQLYGMDFCVIDGYCLVHNGWGGNEFFFETAPSLTYSFIKSLEGSSRTITGK